MENKIIAVIILLAVLFFAGATTFIYWGSRIQERRKIFKKAMVAKRYLENKKSPI